MKKILLLLLISIGLISLVYYELQNDNTTTAILEAEKAAILEAEKAAILDAELAVYEADLLAKLALQEKEAKMARQAALDAFQANLAADKAAAAASTAAYLARIASEAIEAEIDEFEAQLMEELLEESTGIELTITGETHNLCRSTLGLSEINIQLYNKALLGGYLGSIGPQVENGTEFSSTRWDNYISCISSLNSEL